MERRERREGFPRHHDRHAAALQLLLSQTTYNHGVIDGGALRTRPNHERKTANHKQHAAGHEQFKGTTQDTHAFSGNSRRRPVFRHFSLIAECAFAITALIALSSAANASAFTDTPSTGTARDNFARRATRIDSII